MAGLRKLLVIDGDAAMRNRVAIRMGDFFDVVQASTLKDGKASVGDVQPACIVLELNLPCQHGIATLDAVQGLFPECPIVVHTDDLVRPI
jgi:DNA-binding NtrC family response regulator